MSFDQPTRRLLAKMVASCRTLLVDDYTEQLSRDYGMHKDGLLLEVDRLQHLDASGQIVADQLREQLAHFEAVSTAKPTDQRREAYERLVLELGFTAMNRLAALRICEERDLIAESVRRGTNSQGFQLFDRVANGVLGDAHATYRAYLELLFDELAVDLGALFDRRHPTSLVFPSETCLPKLLDELDAKEISHLWAEDETIGWVYQFWNSPEERKAMRDASAAPRNSRELAVRNQLFTPRYVVQFLTDNTLGRTWYEMRQGKTGLIDTCEYMVRRPSEAFLSAGEQAPGEEKAGEDLTQEELLRKTVYIPFRATKDPRDIKVLDPACGSGHFLLYAFDLLETIYEEAWDANEGPASEVTGKTLRDDYADLDELRKAMPALAMRHNLWGVEIDPRCTQIAALALWLRAQRSYQRLGLKGAARPVITKSNIVCAEPMPGERDLLEEYLLTVDDRIQPLVREVWKKMLLAGEAGSLLKVEEDIEAALTRARQERLVDAPPVKVQLFEPTAYQEVMVLLASPEEREFWQEAERKILSALEGFAAATTGGKGTQRGLFADDAAQGFAFIDVCRNRYDVVLMNPPFGEPSLASTEYLRSMYPAASDNLLLAFIERFHIRLTDLGKLGALTDRSWINKRYYERFRREFVLDKQSLESWLDLGWNVLDANVEVAAHIHSRRNQSAVFFNVSSSTDKAAETLVRLKDIASSYTHRLNSFSGFPGHSIVYDLYPTLARAFAHGSSLSKTEFTSFGGLKAANADSLFRLAWEVPAQGISDHSWARLQNGSPFSPYYYGCYYVVRCDNNEWNSLLSYESSRITNIDRYHEPGIFYGKRTDWMYGYKGRAGQVPSMEGHLILPLDSRKVWLDLLIINSSVYQEVANKLCGQHKYAGYINPIHMDLSSFPDWSERAVKATMQLESIDEGNETSGSFVQPLSLSMRWHTENVLAKAVASAIKKRGDFSKFANDLRASYNSEVESALRWPKTGGGAPKEVDYVRLYFESTDSEVLEAAIVLSYVVGCLFGRWDIRLSTGEKLLPPEIDAFAPLPACAPGQLQNEDGLPLTEGDVAEQIRQGQWRYPIDIPWEGIIVEDPSDPRCFEAQLLRTLELLWGDKTEAAIHDLCVHLGVGRLGDYLARPAGFFADHLRHYSKGRRQAPIYWPLSTASGSYTLWVHYHRLDADTLYRALNGFVEPKMEATTREITRWEGDLLSSNEAKSREAYEEAKKLLEELTDFRDELLRVAALPYKPNLNDGVLINAAPLWKLFRLPKWRRDLEACWKKLEAGEFDWSHMAYSIWPDRVREICKTDRSIAIAHDLEELYVASPAARNGRRRAAVVELDEDDE